MIDRMRAHAAPHLAATALAIAPAARGGDARMARRVWSALVNSSATGLASLQQVFGAELPSRFRAWPVSLDLDDVAGSDARYLEPLPSDVSLTLVRLR